MPCTRAWHYLPNLPCELVDTVSHHEFLRYIFGAASGFIRVATIDRTDKFLPHFYKYPEDVDFMLDFIARATEQHNIFFSPHLFSQKTAKKEYVVETPVAWADGDTCTPADLMLPPSAMINTSEGRFSYLWKFHNPIPPDQGEDISKRIAYAHSDRGMDKSGWDLTQLLRFPGTINFKYDPPYSIPNATLIREEYNPSEIRDKFPHEIPIIDLPPIDTVDVPDVTAEELLDKYKLTLNPTALDLFYNEPTGTWSETLWGMELMLFEAGMAAVEVFVVAKASACNKYERDNRQDDHLWTEVLRAEQRYNLNKHAPVTSDYTEDFVFTAEAPSLLTNDERDRVLQRTSFVEQYTNWASKLGDAAIQYHPAGALVILSCLLSGSVILPTSFGTIKGNLWVLILADTTITRKSTAMDNAVDLLLEADSEVLLATDGSVEGLLQGMSTRPKKPSLFFRDEFTGLVDALGKKDYLAGMMETLTKMYDGKTIKRVLKRETVLVDDPIFILYAGGIRTKMIDLIDYRHISSGFMPRFIFITAEADITRLRPVGPPTQQFTEEREQLLKRCIEIQDHYSLTRVSDDGRRVTSLAPWTAELTDDAWVRYNKYEMKMLQAALNSSDSTLATPMMDRLAKSGLKVAMLIAASRCDGDDTTRTVTVTDEDIIHAFYYVEQWQKHTYYIVNNLDASHDERKLRSIVTFVKQKPGVSRGLIMKRFSMNAREADNAFATLEQRLEIERIRSGPSQRFYPYGQSKR